MLIDLIRGFFYMPQYRSVDFIPALLISVVAFVSTAFMTMAPPAADPSVRPQAMAVVFPPWVDLPTALGRVARADGRALRQGLFGNIVVAVSDDPAFPDMLFANGALFVLDPSVLGGCLAGPVN